jgi:hypothetical protein
MEPRFGYDFGGVRVHVDRRAQESAAAVGALAYTVGRHVVLREGVPSRETAAGKRLLAHELAHVVQQSGRKAASRAGGPLALQRQPSPKPAANEDSEAPSEDKWKGTIVSAVAISLARGKCGFMTAAAC